MLTFLASSEASDMSELSCTSSSNISVSVLEEDVIGVTSIVEDEEYEVLAPKPAGFSRIGGGVKTFDVGGAPAAVLVDMATGSIFRLFRIMIDVAVVTMLFVTQYTHRAEGTFNENHPIIRGRSFKTNGCCAAWSFGVMSSIEAYCDRTKKTGRTKNASVSSHPNDGAPFTHPSNNHAEPLVGSAP